MILRFTFHDSRFTGGYAAACAVFDRLAIVQRAASLGGTESLCSMPVLTSQYGLNDEQLAKLNVMHEHDRKERERRERERKGKGQHDGADCH